MMIVVAYDVNVMKAAGRKRLRQVAKICMNNGQRVQYSVFECLVSPSQWEEMKKNLECIIDEKTDRLRYYYLGKNWSRRMEKYGLDNTYDPEGFLMF